MKKWWIACVLALLVLLSMGAALAEDGVIFRDCPICGQTTRFVRIRYGGNYYINNVASHVGYYKCSLLHGDELAYLDDSAPHSGGTATCYALALCDVCNLPYGNYANHEYQPVIIPRTCEHDGYVLYACTRCEDSYIDNDTIVPHWGHWYGEWTANGNGMHRAECLRGGCRYEKTVDCEMIDLPSLNVALCPVCGMVNDGSRLALTSASVQIVSGRIPYGEAILRLGTLASGEKLLTVGYGYGGQLSQASCQVKITLPAELLSGSTLSLLNADGTETAVDFTVDGESAVFTLTFAQSLLPVRLVPAN